jgi:hypothetical protein
VFAAAFARDLGESPKGLRAHVLGTIALRGILEVWNAWYERHAGDVDFDPSGTFELKADYLTRVLEAGEQAVATLPTPASA